MFKRNVVTFCLLAILSFFSPSRAIISSENGEDRISGGTNNHHFALASIRSVNNQGNFHICGGFIINKHWVGTAAQCMTHKTINNTAVAVGSSNIGGGTVYDVNRIEKHNYNALTLANDIALLRTTIEIIFSSSVGPIPLATDFLQGSSISITIFGWGRISEGSNFSDRSLSGNFATLTLGQCLDRFPFIARRFINDRQICGSAATRATCPGDAGSPLIFNSTVIGIASWVEPCVAGQTNVNTRISFYANWILRFTREDD